MNDIEFKTLLETHCPQGFLLIFPRGKQLVVAKNNPEQVMLFEIFEKLIERSANWKGGGNFN